MLKNIKLCDDQNVFLENSHVYWFYGLRFVNL